MGPPRGRLIPAGSEALESILANRFQHRETGLGLGPVHALDQILVHQGRQPFKKIDAEVATGVADRFRRLQRASADKHGKPAKQFPFGLIQKTVTPINGLAKRLLPFWQVEGTTSE